VLASKPLFRGNYVVAALVLTSLSFPAVAAQVGAHSKRHMTAAKLQRADVCSRQASAQHLHFDARRDFLQSCMGPKKTRR
jgi:hypothetical protein